MTLDLLLKFLLCALVTALCYLRAERKKLDNCRECGGKCKFPNDDYGHVGMWE